MAKKLLRTPRGQNPWLTAIRQAGLPRQVSGLLRVLLEFIDWTTGRNANVSKDTIRIALGYKGMNEVDRAIREAEELGVLLVHVRAGSHGVNRYDMQREALLARCPPERLEDPQMSTLSIGSGDGSYNVTSEPQSNASRPEKQAVADPGKRGVTNPRPIRSKPPAGDMRHAREAMFDQSGIPKPMRVLLEASGAEVVAQLNDVVTRYRTGEIRNIGRYLQGVIRRMISDDQLSVVADPLHDWICTSGESEQERRRNISALIKQGAPPSRTSNPGLSVGSNHPDSPA